MNQVIILIVPVLVDGNNVMHALADAGIDAGRSMLCDLLVRYWRRHNTAVAVVFDGSPPPVGEARRLAYKKISVRFAGERTADEVLADLVRDSSAPRSLTVVSSDRAVRRRARRRHCRVVDAATFVRWLTAPEPASGEPAEPKAKRDGLDREQTKQWLEEFGFADEADTS